MLGPEIGDDKYLRLLKRRWLLEQGSQMLSEQAQRAQRPTPTKISAGEALALAHERFPNLAAAGILGAKQSGQPIDPAHVTRALAFMAQCRKSKVPAVHSHDLRQAIGNVSLGATIAASVGLGFALNPWRGVTSYEPHALIGVNASDVREIGSTTGR
jgi:hypothetical protein